MTALIDLAGETFGRWTVFSYAGRGRWNCRCECGTEKPVDGGSLRKGSSQGCLECHPGRDNRKTHGETTTRLYNIWRGMRARCNNPSEPAYVRYGGRGIRVCSEWDGSYEDFRAWALANGYEDHLTIDRYPDRDGDYEPSNCRWSTYAEQNRNYSRNRPISYKGREVLVCDLAAEVGIPQDILKNRIFRYGWDVERAVSTPVQERVKREPWKAMGMSRSAYYRWKAAQ